MHEQAICQSVLDVVLEAAAERPVSRVRVRVGGGLNVSTESFAQWFEMLAADTAAAGAIVDQRITGDNELAVEEIALGDGEVLRNPAFVRTGEEG
ncbi:MAG: hydrogenase/urease maturation nickel metallochaperone HypA [Candidatus Limnocylindria bacterium]